MEKFNVKNGLSVGVDKLSIIDAVGSLSAASVTVNGQYTLPSLDGTSSQVIATDGSGNLSFISLSSGSGGADISGLSANWESTYTTVSTNSSSWGPQTLSFDESTANLTITNGNTVSLSALSSVNMGLFYNRWSFTGNGTLSSFSISGANTSVSEAFAVTIDAVIQDPISYTVDAAADTITFSGVPELSSVIVIVEQYLSAVDGSPGGSGGGSDISGLSANWKSTYTTVSTNSSSWVNSLYAERSYFGTGNLSGGITEPFMVARTAMRIIRIDSEIYSALGSTPTFYIYKNGTTLTTEISVNGGPNYAGNYYNSTVVELSAAAGDRIEVYVSVDGSDGGASTPASGPLMIGLEFIRIAASDPPPYSPAYIPAYSFIDYVETFP